MQQMAGHMNLLNPFVFNQFGPYGAYAQVNIKKEKKTLKKYTTIKTTIKGFQESYIQLREARPIKKRIYRQYGKHI